MSTNKEIKLCAHKISTIMGSVVNMIGLYDHLMSMSVFTLRMNKIFLQAPITFDTNGYGHNLDCQSSQINCVLHIL